MPRKQVYGKRSRAIYDPFQAFASPQRPAPKGNLIEQGIFVAEVVEELSKLKIVNKKDKDDERGNRKALGKKSANETVVPVKAALDPDKTKRRRRKIVESESEDVENEEMAPEENYGVPRRRQAAQRTARRKLEQAKEPHSQEKHNDFMADNVLIFMDGHGYDTKDEGIHTQHQRETIVSTHAHPQAESTPQDSEAPSISILPPTPPPQEDECATYCSPLLGLSSHGITNFTEWTNQITTHFAITKIAEASFGEVYRLSLLEDLAGFSHSDESVLKIIALEPPESRLPSESNKKDRTAALRKAEAMSKVDDVANEVKLLQRMSTTPGFTNFRDVRIMRGRPPQPFVKAFKDFNAEQKARRKDLSVFPDPGKKGSYCDEQLWAVIEMQDAGVDLERVVEKGECAGVWAVWDVFWQVVLALAKGEEGAEFEHRDLHLGNVCVRGGEEMRAEGEGGIETKRKLGFTGLETTIIDYTISRARLTCGTPTAAAAEGTKDIAFHDLSHPSSTSIFEGESTEEYQYDIYRYMRGCVLKGDPYYNPLPPSPGTASTPPPDCDSSWSAYHPCTNLIWLHYLLHSLLEQLAWPSATKAPPKKKNAGKDHAIWKRANDLEHVLLRAQELLDPAEICGVEGLGSAGKLVELALEEGWLDVRDVVGGDGEEVSEEGEEGELVEGSEESSVGGNARTVGEGDTLGAVVEDGVPAGDEGQRGGRTRRRRQ